MLMRGAVMRGIPLDNWRLQCAGFAANILLIPFGVTLTT